MTVTSLWTALDEAKCGRAVGTEDFNLRTSDDSKPTVLAVDLSIWICEALSSTALCTFHKDPAVYLVYQRTTKLLRLGLDLIFVVEGKRRVRSDDDSPELQLRKRSGSKFWSASERCASLLRLLGVLVLQAEAEGEALCALLNQRGVCDGVVSNDGDCFLFGSKVLYTKFTVENLESRQVMRYNADRLHASVDTSYSAKDHVDSSTIERISLVREDLIAFALLTGSDLLGAGVPNIGYKKTINLLHALKRFEHRSNDRTCLDHLLKWGEEVEQQSSSTTELCMECDDNGPSTINTRCCSVCLHPGDKLQHEKNGCKTCGTEKGEGCFIVTAREKFVRSVKAKVLMLSSFAKRSIVDEYFSPNSNTLPSDIVSLKSSIVSPNVSELFRTSLIVKGQNLSSSIEYIRETLPPLLARLELWKDQRNKYITKQQKYKPFPARIERQLVKDFTQCYEIQWSLDMGDGGTLEFCTIESQSLLQQSKYSSMTKAFHQEDRRKRQELDRQKHFGQVTHKGRPTNVKRREKNLQRNMKPTRRGKRRERHFGVSAGEQPRLPTISEQSNDVLMLMGSIPSNLQSSTDKSDEEFRIESDEEDTNDNGIMQDDSLQVQAPMRETKNGDHHKIDGLDNEEDEKAYNYEASLGLLDMNINHDVFGFEEHSTGLSDCSNSDQVKDGSNYHYLMKEPQFSSEYFSQESNLSLNAKDAFDTNMGIESNDKSYADQALTDSHGEPSYKKITKKETAMPTLTPSKKLFVDLGIQVEVTPILSRRWR